MYHTSRRVATKMHEHQFLCDVKYYEENEITFFHVFSWLNISKDFFKQGRLNREISPKNDYWLSPKGTLGFSPRCWPFYAKYATIWRFFLYRICILILFVVLQNFPFFVDYVNVICSLFCAFHVISLMLGFS